MRALFLKISALLALLSLTSCSTARLTPFEIIPDMDHQQKWKAQMENPFFKNDQRASRKPVEGSVAQGKLFEDDSIHTRNVRLRQSV